MQWIVSIFAIFGLGWALTILMIGIFGGRFLIQIRNPITKELDDITDVQFNK